MSPQAGNAFALLIALSVIFGGGGVWMIVKPSSFLRGYFMVARTVNPSLPAQRRKSPAWQFFTRILGVALVAFVAACWYAAVIPRS
jgi:hypothetical protein